MPNKKLPFNPVFNCIDEVLKNVSHIQIHIVSCVLYTDVGFCECTAEDVEQLLVKLWSHCCCYSLMLKSLCVLLLDQIDTQEVTPVNVRE